MGLSEHEQRLLDELERGLYESDANFAKKVANVPNRAPASRLVGGALLAVVGLSVLVFAAITQWIVFGVVGFIIMFVGVVIGSSNWPGSTLGGGSDSGKPKAPKTDGGAKGGWAGNKPTSFFEERWNRRQGD